MDHGIVVYHTDAWRGFLISFLFPEAQVVEWQFGQKSCDVIDRIAVNTAVFVFHISFSDGRQIPINRTGLLAWLNTNDIPAFNGLYHDLSRRFLQQRLGALGLKTAIVTRLDEADLWVIIKTDPNYGGEAELRLSERERRSMEMQFSGALLSGSRSYRVMRLADVPLEVWQSQDYVVERYISNSKNSFYRAYVSGTVIIIVKAHSEFHIKKISGDPRDENWVFHVDDIEHESADVSGYPLQIRAAVKKFICSENLEFGSIDIVHNDADDAFIIDVNTNPWGGDFVDDEILKCLRAGFFEAVARKKWLRDDHAVDHCSMV